MDETIGAELVAELEDAASRHSMILAELAQAPPRLSKLVLHRVRAWLQHALEGQLKPEDEEKIRSAVAVLLQCGATEDAVWLKAQAQSRLRASPAPQEIGFWLLVLTQTDLQAFVDALEQLAASIEPAKNSPVVEWFATLFFDRSDTVPEKLREHPRLLLRVVRLANRHIRLDDDQSHEGISSQDVRDNAQRSRSVLANALLNLSGPGTWEVKMDYARDPEVASYRDRIHVVAQEQLARDWDNVVLSEVEVVQLEREHEFAPKSRVEMAAVLEARLADIEDLLLHDTSPRELWGKNGTEKLLRREIAATLQRLARGAYLVNQEAVTGDEKETDIRLCSTSASLEAVIELKVGDNDYSFSDLQAALRDQLVGKYMAPEHRRVGCLLISISGGRRWKDPETGQPLGIEAVVERLNEQARLMMTDLGYGALLLVKQLDLRPPLDATSPSPMGVEA